MPSDFDGGSKGKMMPVSTHNTKGSITKLLDPHDPAELIQYDSFAALFEDIISAVSLLVIRLADIHLHTPEWPRSPGWFTCLRCTFQLPIGGVLYLELDEARNDAETFQSVALPRGHKDETSYRLRAFTDITHSGVLGGREDLPNEFDFPHVLGAPSLLKLAAVMTSSEDSWSSDGNQGFGHHAQTLLLAFTRTFSARWYLATNGISHPNGVRIHTIGPEGRRGFLASFPPDVENVRETPSDYALQVGEDHADQQTRLAQVQEYRRPLDAFVDSRRGQLLLNRREWARGVDMNTSARGSINRRLRQYVDQLWRESMATVMRPER